MRQHLNTLFVTTPGAYLAKIGKTVSVRIEGEIKLRVPIHAIGSVVCFGAVGVSPALMGLCARSGVAITFCNRYGGFLAFAHGAAQGNVLLRREHYRAAEAPERALSIARGCVTGKIANCRVLVQRAARENSTEQVVLLQQAARELARCAEQAWSATDLDALRGTEGEAARIYFAAFGRMLTSREEGFSYVRRSRRPPLDPVNSLLSFAYAMLALDVRAACESVGLDSYVGFLHRDRAGRPGLALDLMEEFRPVIADRVVLSLINRQQVRADGFERQESGAYLMTDAARKAVLKAYQERKQEVITHPFLDEKTTIGLLPFLQARLLARHIRGELDAYPAFLWR
jgi:CRISPR-associated protein Cas1